MKTEANKQKTETINRVMGIKEWSLIVILSILWGGSFFFVGVAVKEMPPLTIVLCRVALASIILLAIVYLKGDKMPSSPGLWGAFIIMGALNNLIPFSLIVWGQTHIESGLASILNATTPIFSVVLAHFFNQRRTTHNESDFRRSNWLDGCCSIDWDRIAAGVRNRSDRTNCGLGGNPFICVRCHIWSSVQGYKPTDCGYWYAVWFHNNDDAFSIIC